MNALTSSLVTGEPILLPLGSKELSKILESKNTYENLIKQGLEDLQQFNGKIISKEYLQIIKQ